MKLPHAEDLTVGARIAMTDDHRQVAIFGQGVLLIYQLEAGRPRLIRRLALPFQRAIYFGWRQPYWLVLSSAGELAYIGDRHEKHVVFADLKQNLSSADYFSGFWWLLEKGTVRCRSDPLLASFME